MRVNVNCALYGRCYAVARRFMLAAFLCCFFYGMSNGAGRNLSTIGGGRIFQRSDQLKVGDDVPDVLMNMMNYETTTARLSDFRGKVVILDFWATWCGSCISEMPKEDSLQQIFGSAVQFLLVSTHKVDKAATINSFIRNRTAKHLYTPKLPIVIEDSTFDKYFPHDALPHYVLLDAHGIVSAITSGNQVNFKNIADIVAGREVKIHQKNDAEMADFSKSYLLEEDNIEKVLLLDISPNNHSAVESAQKTAPYTVFSREIDLNITKRTVHGIDQLKFDGVRYINFELGDLIFSAYPEMQEIPRRRWIIEKSIEGFSKDSPKFCFELMAPGGVPADIVNDWLKLDIFKALKIFGEIIYKDTTCYVIKGGLKIRRQREKTDSIDDKLALNNIEYLLRDYISELESSSSTPVVIDRSYLLESISVPKGSDFIFEHVRNVLSQNGYSIETKKEKVPFFHITAAK